MRARCAALGAVCALCVACATLGEDTASTPGGARDLPNRGIVPYETVQFLRGTTPSPWLYPPPLTPELPAVRDPSAVALDDAVALFAHVTTAEGVFIGRADAPTGLDFGPFEPVLAELPEGAAAPAVARDAGGTWHLLLASPEGLLHAESADGRAFGPTLSNWLTPEGDDEAGGIGAPSLVFDGETAHVYYEARAAAEEGTDPPPLVVRHVALDAAGHPQGARRTVLHPGTDCTDPQGQPFPCWNKDAVGQPEVRRATTGSGRTLWRMFFTGGRGELSAVGFAAADAPDGDFTPYLYNPIVKDSQRSRAGPTNVRFGDGYLLYFTQPTAKPAVGVAIDDAGVPSERF